MRINTLIKKLQEIKKTKGNINVAFDTSTVTDDLRVNIDGEIIADEETHIVPIDLLEVCIVVDSNSYRKNKTLVLGNPYGDSMLED